MKFFSLHKKRAKKPISSGMKEVVISLTILLVPLVSLIVSPGTVHASLFSFISSIAGAPAVADEGTSSLVSASLNSQTLPILESPLTPIGPATSTDDIAIADNTLVASVGPSGSIADIDNLPVNTTISTYVVRDGDTLSTIADLFDVSVNTIVWANDLGAKPVIHAGETLIILPVSGINYTVKKGDSLSSIVANYKADMNEVLEYNDLAPGASLAVGDTIMIPDAELGETTKATPSSTSHKSSGAIYEPIIPGDDGPFLPGYYACPVLGSRLSQGLHGHNAVDLAEGIGNSIYAAADGTVIIAKTGGWNGGYGNYVVISHPNGTETLYAHAEKLLVSAGEHVSQSDIIAKIGVTGETTGPHLHFEVRGAANPFVSIHC
jgi:murein DD-endopeptidase MepM/ murein hydrolase activator NlpD